MQNKIALAFRKRLKGRGYTDICIRYVGKEGNVDYFMVSASEPLFGVGIQGEMTLQDMHNAIRPVKKGGVGNVVGGRCL